MLTNTQPVKTAVILAAGLGSRLGERTKTKPKGFLEIEGISLIERSITALLSVGIERIVIGTGYLSDIYQSLQKQYPQLVFGTNPDYATTGSMYTLHCLKEQISEDFLLLESDLLYEVKALQLLQDSPLKDAVLGSSATHSGDEVFIQTNEDSIIEKMSKRREDLSSIDAELVGISKISIETFKQMNTFAESKFAQTPKLDYEYAIVGVSQSHPIRVLKAAGLVWCEIDDENHLERAVNQVLPNL